jgi:hypothetical protein
LSKRWQTTISSLIQLWTLHSRKWNTNTDLDHYSILPKRLENVILIKSSHNQVRLLLQENPTEVDLDSAFKYFEGILVFSPSRNEKKWASAYKKYLEHIEPALDIVVLKLKQYFFALRDFPLQLFHEFLKCRELLKIEKVKKELSAEFEMMILHLTKIAKSVRMEMQNVFLTLI